MDAAYLSALAALAGSTIGGLTSLASAWVTQDRQARAQLLAQDKAMRQELYKAFIEQASQLYINALAQDKPDIPGLVSLYALLSRMRVLSSGVVIERADFILRMIIETYSSPNRTFEDLRVMMNNGTLDVLHEFSETCRAELQALTKV
jgi:hypothetical protein